MFPDDDDRDVFRLLFFGDLIGKPGRQTLRYFLPRLAEKYNTDLVIVNGENASGGFGLTKDTARGLFDTGVDVITSGNHIWDKKEIIGYFSENHRLLRPANYPEGTPGEGSVVVSARDGTRVGIINLVGRVFIGPFDDPFVKANELVEELKKTTPIIFVDFHGEDTREKQALAHYLDGRVSAIIGTHTHIPTADERILPGGTAFITDAGMCGPTDSVIGVKKEKALARLLTSIPQRFETAKKGNRAQGVVITVDKKTAKSLKISRFDEESPE